MSSLFVVILFKMLRPFTECLILMSLFPVNLSTWINQKSLSAEMYLIVKFCSKIGCKLRLLSVARSIWGYQVLLVGLSNKFSILSKIGDTKFYLLAISYVNPYKCVAKFFLSKLYNKIILALPLAVTSRVNPINKENCSFSSLCLDFQFFGTINFSFSSKVIIVFDVMVLL